MGDRREAMERKWEEEDAVTQTRGPHTSSAPSTPACLPSPGTMVPLDTNTGTFTAFSTTFAPPTPSLMEQTTQWMESEVVKPSSDHQPLKARVLTETLSKNRRSLLLLRCAERVDRVFPDWLQRAFADDGTYQPYDLNFPQRLPVRPNGPLGYHNDPPITALGEVSAGLMGRGLRHRRILPTFILSSPALRCVQTAAEMARTLGGQAPVICLEPGLMEPLGWYPSLPAFLSPEILASCGYPVSRNYKPLIQTEALRGLAGKETSKAAALRIRQTLDCILAAIHRQTPNGNGMVLVVAHAFTLDSGLRALDADAGRDLPVIGRGFLGLAYPYTAHLLLQEHLSQASDSSNWALIARHPKPLPSLTTFHFSNTPLPHLIDTQQPTTPA